jgi:hypothetical protein
MNYQVATPPCRPTPGVVGEVSPRPGAMLRSGLVWAMGPLVVAYTCGLALDSDALNPFVDHCLWMLTTRVPAAGCWLVVARAGFRRGEALFATAALTSLAAGNTYYNQVPEGVEPRSSPPSGTWDTCCSTRSCWRHWWWQCATACGGWRRPCGLVVDRVPVLDRHPGVLGDLADCRAVGTHRDQPSALFTVARASARSRDAPFGEYVDPLRRRAARSTAPSTGRDDREDSVRPRFSTAMEMAQYACHERADTALVHYYFDADLSGNDINTAADALACAPEPLAVLSRATASPSSCRT